MAHKPAAAASTPHASRTPIRSPCAGRWWHGARPFALAILCCCVLWADREVAHVEDAPALVLPLPVKIDLDASFGLENPLWIDCRAVSCAGVYNPENLPVLDIVESRSNHMELFGETNELWPKDSGAITRGWRRVEGGYCFAWFDERFVRVDVHTYGWAAASILPAKHHHIARRIVGAINVSVRGQAAHEGCWRHPCSLDRNRINRGLSRAPGFPHSLAVQYERPNESERASEREINLPPSGVSLRFRSLGRALCGTRRPLLGYEIVGLVLLGALCAFFAALGLYWVFDDPNRNRKPAGFLLAAICLPLGLTFYGWARLGFPGSFWGLC